MMGKGSRGVCVSKCMLVKLCGVGLVRQGAAMNKPASHKTYSIIVILKVDFENTFSQPLIA